MNAALAEVPVHRPFDAVAVQQIAQVTDVAAELVRRDCRVLPAWPVVLTAGERRSAKSAFADLPEVLAPAALLLALRDDDPLLRVAFPAGQPLGEAAGGALRLLGGVRQLRVGDYDERSHV